MSNLVVCTGALTRLKELLIEEHGEAAFNEALAMAELELEAQDQEIKSLHVTVEGHVVK